MKHIFLIATLTALTCAATQAQTVDGRDFSIDGFAACDGVSGTNWYLKGGTTGGAAGKTVYANTFSELQAYLQAEEPYTVIVDHDITTGITAYVDALSTGHLCDKQDGSEGVATTYGERILIASNKTLLGVVNPSTGEAPLFTRITFVMNTVSNIIIRNCRFTMNGAPILKSGENKIVAWRDGAQMEVGDPDCICVQADKTSASTDWGGHVWIDHCEFFNGNAANKDRYDGLLDCKNNVQWMTFSYNYFHDHDKACLFGKGNSDKYNRTISFHHNYFKDIDGSRLPLQRFGFLHYMNNYQDGCEDGWDLRTDATCYLDACYFKDTKSPVRSDRGGSLNINTAADYDSYFTNCRNLPNGYENADGSKVSKYYGVTSSSWLPTDNDKAYFVNSHDKTADVPAILEKYAGAGKIAVYIGDIPAEDLTEFAKAAKNYSTHCTYDEYGNTYTGIPTTEENDASAKVSIDGTASISKTFTADDAATTATIAVSPTRSAATVRTASTAAVAAGANTWTVAIPEAGESVNIIFTVTAKDGTTSRDYSVSISRAEAKDDTDDGDDDGGDDTPATGDATICDFVSGKPSLSYVVLANSNPKNTSFTYNGKSYAKGVKMESKTQVAITPTTDCTITLVFDAESKGFFLDGNKYTTGTDKTYSFSAKAGTTYTLTKGDSMNLYLVIFTSKTTGIRTVTADENAPVYDLLGRRVSNTVRGRIYIQNGRKFVRR